MSLKPRGGVTVSATELSLYCILLRALARQLERCPLWAFFFQVVTEVMSCWKSHVVIKKEPFWLTMSMTFDNVYALDTETFGLPCG
jgi:hypothetical protein